jgi:hypothetical protein
MVSALSSKYTGAISPPSLNAAHTDISKVLMWFSNME